MAASGTFALWAWLAPGIAFLILSLAVPLRRSGRPAAAVSIVFSLGALLAAVWSWRLAVPDMARRVLWDWIPVEDPRDGADFIGAPVARRTAEIAGRIALRGLGDGPHPPAEHRGEEP